MDYLLIVSALHQFTLLHVCTGPRPGLTQTGTIESQNREKVDTERWIKGRDR